MNKLLMLSVVLACAACSRQEPADAPAPAPAPAPVVAAAPTVSAEAAAPILSAEGYGKLRFGAKLADVEQALGAKAESQGVRHPACSMVRFAAAPGLRFMVENGVVTRADADAGIPNSLGVAVGDTLAQVKARAPALAVAPHEYVPDGHYLTISTGDGRAAIVMEEDGKAVTRIRAGLQPAVAYVETCG